MAILLAFFLCSRGVRQCDPLFLLLFCLVEEVLSRVLSKLVNDNKIALNVISLPLIFYMLMIFVFSVKLIINLLEI